MTTFIPRTLILLVLGASLLLAACSNDDNGGSDPAPVLTPSATASPTQASETPAPEPAETPDPSCPIDALVCSLADMLDSALQARDYEAIVDLIQSREETCPGGTPQGAGGPFPLCEGASAGEVRTGYQLARRYSEGWIAGRDGVVAFLEAFVAAASPEMTDAYGSGEVRLQAVGCSLTQEASGACREATVIFAAILEGNRREVLAFTAPLPIDADAPISFARNGILLPDEETAIFETGGEVFGLGHVYVLSE